MSVTFNYRTGRDDTAFASLALDDGTPPLIEMRPNYPLAETRDPTSTKLTWIRRNVPAAGAEYKINFSGRYAAWGRDISPRTAHHRCDRELDGRRLNPRRSLGARRSKKSTTGSQRTGIRDRFDPRALRIIAATAAA